MRKYFSIIFTLPFCIPTYAQIGDKAFDVPEISLSTSFIKEKPLLSIPLFSDTLSCKTPFPLTLLQTQHEMKISETETSVIVKTINHNHSAPTFPLPGFKTTNWWQALGIVGVGLTRGLVFDNFNSF